MDRERVHVDYIYRQDRFVHGADPLTVIALGVQFLQLFVSLIAKLSGYRKKCRKRCKQECQDLQELLESIKQDVCTVAELVESCKFHLIETTPQDSWLKRLRTELLQVEKLTDKCAPRGPRGWFKRLRQGRQSTKSITAKLETFKRFASELPQMHGVLTSMKMTAEVHERVVVGSTTRRIPSYGNHRNPDRTVRYEARPYNSFRRIPSFGRYRNDDAEFLSDRSGGYESRPDDWCHRRPSFENSRYHDEYVCVDGVYLPKARCELIFEAQPIALRSYASFERVPVMNPYYMKHIESEYY